MQKALELADKYGFEIPKAKSRETQVIVMWEKPKYYQKRYVCILAKLYGVAGIMTSRKAAHNGFTHLAGTKKNIELVQTIFELSYAAVDGAMVIALERYKKKLIKENTPSPRAKIEKFRKDFYLGVAHGMAKSVKQAREQHSKGLAEIMETGAAKGLAAYTKKFGAVGKSSAKNVGREAYEAGKASADKVSAGKQLK